MIHYDGAKGCWKSVNEGVRCCQPIRESFVTRLENGGGGRRSEEGEGGGGGGRGKRREEEENGRQGEGKRGRELKEQVE